MFTSTLKGVFPEPKPIYRRNFIKENVIHIKKMQGIIPLSDSDIPNKEKNEKFRNISTKPNVHSKTGLPSRNTTRSTKLGTQSERPLSKHCEKGKEISKIQVEKQRFLSRGIQTERLDDMNKLYENGIIKYPSPCLKKSPGRETSKLSPDSRHGDEMNEAAGDCGLINRNNHNFIKENKKNIIKSKPSKIETGPNPNFAPANYQKGVVPKYLKERKDSENKAEPIPDCPPGHILLPEEERKETLRVLRQSYADRVQELNSLPVRSDTLKMKKKKMDIEEELKKIDEGIKVFQRPKVFVKINA